MTQQDPMQAKIHRRLKLCPSTDKLCPARVKQSIDFTDFHLIPKIRKSSVFLEDVQESAEKAFGDNAHQTKENLLYAQMPSHL